jgi:nitroimidazol reductase NimA-like FMN-containing flavoprotein (pyridoxamine 5'-phosphate oxidase superfamily)
MPSRRNEIEMSEEEIQAFLGEQLVMQCATVGPRGVAHMVPLWFVAEIREMVAKQAQKRIGLRFVPTRVVSWDHRKLGGVY